MIDKFEIDIMVRFLNRHYPVKRIKDNQRFKRSIILDDGYTHFLSNQPDFTSLQFKLRIILMTVFESSEIDIKYAVIDFLGIR